MGLPFIIGVIVVVAIVMGIAGIYNNLVTLRNRVDNAWQNIDTQLQRPHPQPRGNRQGLRRP